MKYRTEIKWGLLFILMLLFWMVLERLLGLHGKYIEYHAVFTNFVAIPAIAIYVFALREKRATSYNGAMSYWQGVKAGFVITAVVTILTPFSQYIISEFISPDYFSNSITYAVEQNIMTQDAASAHFNTISYIKQATLSAPTMGILTSVIVAFFTKRDIPAN